MQLRQVKGPPLATVAVAPTAHNRRFSEEARRGSATVQAGEFQRSQSRKEKWIERPVAAESKSQARSPQQVLCPTQVEPAIPLSLGHSSAVKTSVCASRGVPLGQPGSMKSSSAECGDKHRQNQIAQGVC